MFSYAWAFRRRKGRKQKANGSINRAYKSLSCVRRMGANVTTWDLLGGDCEKFMKTGRHHETSGWTYIYIVWQIVFPPLSFLNFSKPYFASPRNWKLTRKCFVAYYWVMFRTPKQDEDLLTYFTLPFLSFETWSKFTPAQGPQFHSRCWKQGEGLGTILWSSWGKDFLPKYFTTFELLTSISTRIGGHMMYVSWTFQNIWER